MNGIDIKVLELRGYMILIQIKINNSYERPEKKPNHPTFKPFSNLELNHLPPASGSFSLSYVDWYIRSRYFVPQKRGFSGILR